MKSPYSKYPTQKAPVWRRLWRHTLLLYIVLGSLSILLAACQEDEEGANLPEEPDSVLNLQVKAAEGQDLPEGNVQMFVFDADDLLTLHLPYPSLDVLLRAFKPTKAGSHTYLLVMNVGTGFDLPETRTDLAGISLSEFLKRLTLLAEEYPDMSTGIVRVSLEVGRITQATIEMQAGIVHLATLGLELSLPENSFLPYMEQADTRSLPEGYGLRAVVEVWQSGGHNRLLHRVLPLTFADTASHPFIWLENLPTQACDVVIWTDYVPAGQTEDYHYATSDLKAVTFHPDREYVAGADSRDAYAARFSTNFSAGDTLVRTVEMKRPFAKYCIVATDLQRYEQMRDVNDFPPLESIEVRAAYASCFPNSYNAHENRPNNATLEQTYRSALTFVTDSTVQLAADHVWVDNLDSSVRLNLDLVDMRTGDTLSTARDLDIHYRRGCLTTLSGDFLTAGKSSGSITVDERWDGEYNIEF